MRSLPNPTRRQGEAPAEFPLTPAQEEQLGALSTSGLPHVLLGPSLSVTGNLDSGLVLPVLHGERITVPGDPEATAAVKRLQDDCQDVIRRLMALSRLGDPDEAALARAAAYVATTPDGIARAERDAALDEIHRATRGYR